MIPSVKDVAILYSTGLSAREVADRLSTSQGTVKRRLAAAGVKLRTPGWYRQQKMKPSESDANKMVLMYSEGHSYSSISKIFGCSKHRIQNILKNQNVIIRTPYRRRTDINTNEVVRMYSEGEDINSISIALKCSRGAISKRLKDSGVTIKKYSDYSHNHMIDIDATKVIEMYAVGYTATQIGLKFGCSVTPVLRVLKSHNIPIRSTPQGRILKSKTLDVTIRVDSMWEARIYSLLRRSIGDTFLFQGEYRQGKGTHMFSLPKPESIRKIHRYHKVTYDWKPDFICPDQNMILEVKGYFRAMDKWNNIIVPCIRNSNLPYKVGVLSTNPYTLYTWDDLIEAITFL